MHGKISVHKCKEETCEKNNFTHRVTSCQVSLLQKENLKLSQPEFSYPQYIIKRGEEFRSREQATATLNPPGTQILCDDSGSDLLQLRKGKFGEKKG